MKKPIKVFWGELTNKFYATQYYKDLGGGRFEVTGQKFDVTDDIGQAIRHFGIEFTPVPKDDTPPTKPVPGRGV